MPTPGRAGDADDLGVAGVRRERRHHLAQQRRLVLDQRDQPGDRAGLAGAGALDEVRDVGLPDARVQPGDTHDQGVALAAAAAQGGRTDAAAATLELEREVQHDPGAGHADRVAERDRAAVDVDLVRVEAELAGRLDADRGERLVELDQVEVGGRRCPPCRRPSRWRWPAAAAGVESGPATMPCAPISASHVRPSSSALALLITTTARRRRRSARRSRR